MFDHAHADAWGGDSDQPSMLALDPVTSDKGSGYPSKSESPKSSTAVGSVPVNKEKTEARTRNEEHALALPLKYELEKKILVSTRLDNVLKMSESGSESQTWPGEAATITRRTRRATAGADPNIASCPEVTVATVQLEAQDFCTASTSAISTHRQTRKRKVALAGIDIVDKENLNVFLNATPGGPVAIKRICREKTGTDWQTVLDVIAYGEERNRRQNQNTASTAEEK
ncbi:uncharacterized protein F5891DRAFT_1187891 [Suillus fuscotomentosus]|uniref:Uncharacterized protein n=1 Tax=Suillus fuscotomentosus TaxID=1912939 RepID=A0AAD4DU40_9AGAM|nr:uncharacterized protein F5891DRAFT_1195967 [Suillus fuscotomentosus]XP_041226770.1 uncharacterized protein F5891DRAFT_1187891 [Suillus fuscotomentosus]KAG1865743.1 hypothetical protein C8R48DRAFT_672343 [Suillus tomentosus]KAG1893829.1 hypothetical protein F5891DRAFT_1195967 [Suillus fuscotomentosus]KAG1901195.1 hypothetical protein F5891DRAFT_1187891 [Suillus fuscotomentosus]